MALILGVFLSVYMTQLLHKLYWRPVGFQVQFMMLIITFKATYAIEPGYLRDCPQGFCLPYIL